MTGGGRNVDHWVRCIKFMCYHYSVEGPILSVFALDQI